MNIEELKSILNFANVNKCRYSINNNDTGDIYVLQVSNYKGSMYWETYYSDERGGINDYRSFVDEDIACRCFLYELLHYKSSYNDLIKKYIIDYIPLIKDKNILQYYGVSDYNEVMGYSRYKKNIIHHMLQDVNDQVLMNLLYNTTKSNINNVIKSIKNINLCDSNGYTYLHIACKVYDIEVINKLLELGANPNLRNNEGLIPMVYLLYSSKDPADAFILDSMLQHGLNLNIRFNSTYRNKTLKEILDDWWKNNDIYNYIIKKYHMN